MTLQTKSKAGRGELILYSRICIKERKHRTFSLVMAVVNCLCIPFGTALGVFTLIILQRPSVKALYFDSPKSHVLLSNRVLSDRLRMPRHFDRSFLKNGT